MKTKSVAPVYRLDAERVGKEAACSLGDERLEKRMQSIVSTMCKRPAASFPDLFKEDSELEAVYCFLRNERLSLGKTLRGHIAHTVGRVQSLKTVVVAHDTTEFDFAIGQRRRDGLQRFSQKRQGFLAHVSLCMSADGARAPLGCLGLQPFVRLNQLENATDQAAWQQQMGSGFTEAGRWLKGIRHSERVLGKEVSAIHVCDREGDAYPVLSKLVQANSRFVTRLAQNRTVTEPETGHLLDFIAEQPVLGLSRQVQLSERLQASVLPADRKTHPARKSRSAELVLRCAQVTLNRPAKRNSDGQSPQSVTLNVVDVSEVNVPSGEPPVRWTLATTEPIDSEAACWRIVDLYRSRWLVEEFFKVIKTGCGFRFRQLDSHKTLLAVLGLCVPVAWTLLLMRYLEREAPDSPAEAVLPQPLLGFLKRIWPRGPAPEQPTVREALRAIAALGDHIRHNGPPDWLVLHRGYEQLLLMYEGFCAAFPEGRCDQS